MSEVKRLIIKDNGEEYEIRIESGKELSDAPDGREEPGYRDGSLTTVSMEEVRKHIQASVRYVIGAFKEFNDAEIEELTLKFGLKVGGKTGIPFVTEGSTEGNFEVGVKCKFPNRIDK